MKRSLVAAAAAMVPVCVLNVVVSGAAQAAQPAVQLEHRWSVSSAMCARVDGTPLDDREKTAKLGKKVVFTSSDSQSFEGFGPEDTLTVTQKYRTTVKTTVKKKSLSTLKVTGSIKATAVAATDDTICTTTDVDSSLTGEVSTRLRSKGTLRLRLATAGNGDMMGFVAVRSPDDKIHALSTSKGTGSTLSIKVHKPGKWTVFYQLEGDPVLQTGTSRLASLKVAGTFKKAAK